MLNVGLSKMRVSVGVYIEGTNAQSPPIGRIYATFCSPEVLMVWEVLVDCALDWRPRGDLLFTESWRPGVLYEM